MKNKARDWTRLESEFFAELARCGFADEAAKMAARCIMHCLQRDHGGERLYVPVLAKPKPCELVPGLIRAGFSAEKIRTRLGVTAKTMGRWRAIGLLGQDRGRADG
jgi:hypothetical protein